MKLKLEFQNWLESVFTEDRYTLDEIRKKLDISKDAARSLSKLMDIDRGAYKREDIIRCCMGGKIIDLEEI
jgi:predicted transcriptional regulator